MDSSFPDFQTKLVSQNYCKEIAANTTVQKKEERLTNFFTSAEVIPNIITISDIVIPSTSSNVLVEAAEA